MLVRKRLGVNLRNFLTASSATRLSLLFWLDIWPVGGIDFPDIGPMINIETVRRQRNRPKDTITYERNRKNDP